jgi:hypothetical protein
MYFQSLPKIFYSLSGKKFITPSVTVNIMTRAKLLDSVKTNSFVYYTYDVKDTDTPEIIAEKYYGDSSLHWIILLANDIIDPLYDWVMPSNEFNKYIIGKYGDIPTAKTTIDHYIKTITKYDSQSGDTTAKVYTIDLSTFNSLPDSEFETVNLQNGYSVEITITRGIVYSYDQEQSDNEAKRNIKIIDKQYTGQLQTELRNLYK